MTVEPRDPRFPSSAQPSARDSSPREIVPRQMRPRPESAAATAGAPLESLPRSTASNPMPDPRWELAERVLTAPLFEKSPRLRSFLRFICEQELAGRRLSINEHEIGVHVFGRPAAYNPGEDSIVRSQARFLRQRLEEYFRTAGQDEPVRIVIPKGSYVPVFEPNAPAPPYRNLAEPMRAGGPIAESNASGLQAAVFAETAGGGTQGSAAMTGSSLTAATDRATQSGTQTYTAAANGGPEAQSTGSVISEPAVRRRGFLLGLIVGVVIAVMAIALLFVLTPGVPAKLLPGIANGAASQSTPEQRFWKAIFDPHRATVVVPADSTLILIEEMTRKPVTLQGYLTRDYLSRMPLAEATGSAPSLTAMDLATSHYTSMADLNLVSRLSTVPELSAAHVEIRSARELSISDAKEDNLVLIGGPRANPWVELFANRMNFYVDYDWATHTNTVINKAPRSGEMPLYAETSSDPAHRVYGLIAFQPSLDHEGDALLVAGTSSAGTQSAADFLLNGRIFGAFLRSIERSDRTIPHFEILLEARSLGAMCRNQMS